MAANPRLWLDSIAAERQKRQVARIEADVDAARQQAKSLIGFSTLTKPNYIEGWFNRHVASALQQFYLDVMAGRQPRLMIFAPPRSGKSELFSRRFPAWALGQNPDLQIIATSYAADLASRTNRDVQRVIDDPAYLAIFPETRLNGKNAVTISGAPSRNSDIFEIVNHGGAYRSAGVGGGITGMGADIAIIDDPIKDAKEANSETVRNSVWDWYTTTLYTRLSPKSGILLGMTRWHQDDLAGRLLDEMKRGEGDRWQVISFPAIADEDEQHRSKGDALHPERYPVERLLKIKSAIGSHAWNALYQQAPSDSAGGIFKTGWWQYFTPEALPPLKRVIQSWDTAFKTNTANDYSVCTTWGESVDGNLYLLDVWKEKVEFPALKRMVVSKAAQQWGGLSPSAILVEDKASGQSLIQELRTGTRLSIVAIKVETDKVSRAYAVTPVIESKRVYLPEGAPWAADYVASLASFPNAAHDDDVDSTTQALAYLTREQVASAGFLDLVRDQNTARAAAETAVADQAQRRAAITCPFAPGSMEYERFMADAGA